MSLYTRIFGTQVVTPTPGPLAPTHGTIGGAAPGRKKLGFIVAAIVGLGVAAGLIVSTSDGISLSSSDGGKKAAVGSGSAAVEKIQPATPVTPARPTTPVENPSQKTLDRLASLETELKELRECVDGSDADGNLVDCALQERLSAHDKLFEVLGGKVDQVREGLADEKILRKNLEVVVKGHWGWVKKLRGDKTPPTAPPAPTPADDEDEIEMEGDPEPTPTPTVDPTPPAPAADPAVEPAPTPPPSASVAPGDPVEVRLD